MIRGLLFVVAGCGRVAFEALPVRDAGSDSSDGGDGGVTAHCGGPGAITDNFDDGVRAATWNGFIDDPSMTLVETGGELSITLADNVTGPNYAGYIESRTTDLRGTRVFVEVTGVPAPAAVGEAGFAMFGDLQNVVTINEQMGMLRALVRTAGADTQIATIAYDAGAQRWWQIREDAGTIYYEYSPDGIAYTPFATTPTATFASHARIELYGGTYYAVLVPGQVHFDNLNGGGAPLEPWCKASSFRDSFTAGTVGLEWTRSYTNGACTVAESGGAGVITLDPAATSVCAFATGADYDLTGDSVFVSLQSTPNPAVDTYSFLTVSIGQDAEVFTLGQSLTDVVCNEIINTAKVERCRTPFIPAQQSFWRLREQGGSIVWEIGPDGTAWTQMATVPYTFSFTDVHVEFGAGANGATGSPGGVAFAAYNE